MGRYAILVDGVVTNIVTATPDVAELNGWVEAVGEYATIPTPVVIPDSVTMAQARKALNQHGITAAMVDTAIAGIEDDGERTDAQIDWEFATHVRRDSELVVSLGAELGLSESEIDALFVEAVKL
jgi:hypothetical protein